MINAPVAASDGMPSWSYAQVLDESADSVHLFVPATMMDCVGALCPSAIEYESTNTDCAVPATMGAAPDPTRTTASPAASNGCNVPVGVAVADTELVSVRGGVDVELAVAGDV